MEDIRKEQQADGSWGRFHTQDTRLKLRYPTTENAVLRLHTLGLTRDHAVVERACAYMENLLANLELWPDAWERNKWYRPATPLFISSKLAMFGSENRCFKETCAIWLAILRQSFTSGSYAKEDADSAAEEFLGVNIHGKYIGLNSINALILYSHIKDEIPTQLQRRYMHWLHTCPENIVYTSTRLDRHPVSLSSKTELTSWLLIMGYLSAFDGFKHEFANEIDWLLQQRGIDGLWDFGQAFNAYKLSDSWRSDLNRKLDQSTYAISIVGGVV